MEDMDFGLNNNQLLLGFSTPQYCPYRPFRHSCRYLVTAFVIDGNSPVRTIS
jgi:hypothetical protein